MQPQHPDWGAPKPSPPPPELLRPLLLAADAVGRLVQYSHQVPLQHSQAVCNALPCNL
jgi:hypothetical protein